MTEALLDVSNMTRHTLVVGATGSGKTSTLLALLRAARRKRPGLSVTILEGAKSEYRGHHAMLGVNADQLYDFDQRTLSLNIFEHPEFVPPEEHINQLSAIFAATMDVPPPVPAILKEALMDAYSSYHAEEDPRAKRLHPIRYWLYWSARDKGASMGYAGESQSTINGILRTRIGSLSRGTAGRILSGRGGGDWESTLERLNQSAILELERVADPTARSLIMALFVLYFRYAVRSAGRHAHASRSDELRHLLVLEEAHRIIGKSHTGAQDISLEFFSNILSEIRAEGCGVIICDQSPSKLIDDAMRNTNTKIIMRLVSGEDIRIAVHGGGLPDEAMRDVPRLQTFEAIVLTPDHVPRFVRIDNPYSSGTSFDTGSESQRSHEDGDSSVARRRFETDQRLAEVYLEVYDTLQRKGESSRSSGLVNAHPAWALPIIKAREFFSKGEASSVARNGVPTPHRSALAELEQAAEEYIQRGRAPQPKSTQT
jgi:energy-coupling factor transporter ATP-binding protein EcfA2